MKFFYSLLILLTLFKINSQDRKTIEAYRFLNPPLIDGIISEDEWKKTTPAKDFTLFKPQIRAGEKIPIQYETVVNFGYDNNAVYVSAQLNHPDPYNIPSEFSERDETDAISERFVISIDTYDNKKERVNFMVTSAGSLIDGVSSGDFSLDDLKFDTLFDAKVQKNEEGWSLEVIIPYSALRFPKKTIHNWGINFIRDIKDIDESYVWSPVDERVFKYHETLGLVKNITNITPPVRMFFYPYLQTSLSLQKGLKSSSGYSAGLDFKYGINNSFTLDATLIPDFGQVSFDNEELNLSPFEQQFDENRAFFTEGANLFEIVDGASYRGGNFFYSRRIGQKNNIDEDEILNEGDILLSYDEKSDLLNSIKITGTTNKSLSIGFLNAITAKSYAYIQDSDGNTRNKLLSPISNYNILSLSQKIINDYSTIGFINANLTRESNFDDANNYAFMTDLFDNKRKYNFKGYFFKTISPRLSKKNGIRSIINLSEIKGNFRFSLGWNATDRYYNQNEIGFYNGRNFMQFSSQISYQILNKNKFFRRFNSSIYIGYQKRFDSRIKNRSGWRFSTSFQTNDLWRYSISSRYVSKIKDWYETRTENRFILDPKSLSWSFGIDSDNTRKFSYGADYEFTNYKNHQFNEERIRSEYRFYLDYRLSNNLSLNIRTKNEKINDDIGYVSKQDGMIYFGIRDVKAIENNLKIDFKFDRDRTLSLRLRNFWSSANYDEILFQLLNNGNLENTDYDILDKNPNTNFNIWNLDLNFEWWFAPGSNVVFLYRNQIFNRDNQSGINYYNSLKNLFEIPIEHQFSLRLNYLIDYNKLRKRD